VLGSINSDCRGAGDRKHTGGQRLAVEKQAAVGLAAGVPEGGVITYGEEVGTVRA